MTLEELNLAVLSFLRVHAPGVIPRRLKIEVYDSPEPFVLPINTHAISAPQPSPAPSAATAPAGEQGEKVSACVGDILRTLEEAGRPLTTTRLLEELSRRGKEWSRSCVERYLAGMVEDGTLLNDPNARPRGYRLPEWDNPPE